MAKANAKGNESIIWIASIVGVALCLAGLFWRRTELSKPEAERDQRVIAATTALMVIGGIVLLLWGFLLAGIGTDLIMFTKWT